MALGCGTRSGCRAEAFVSACIFSNKMFMKHKEETFWEWTVCISMFPHLVILLPCILSNQTSFSHVCLNNRPFQRIKKMFWHILLVLYNNWYFYVSSFFSYSYSLSLIFIFNFLSRKSQNLIWEGERSQERINTRCEHLQSMCVCVFGEGCDSNGEKANEFIA